VRTLAIALSLIPLAGIGCQYPRDPEGTLNRVRDGGVMRIGVIDAPPFAQWEGEVPRGVEVDLAKQFARRQRARIEWVDGAESELVKALHERELDLLIGGLDRKSPWGKEIALTRPYVTTRMVVGARPGRDLPDDLDGVTVSAEAFTEVAALLDDKTSARVRRVEHLDEAPPPVAGWDFEVEALGLEQTANELGNEHHVMGVQLGENAFLVALEDFILDRTEEARRMLREEGRP
jgi:polar amino acid transport system substrate-binding protein